ncbi:DUF5677 domain-containing protein [Vibrio genomosp. F6]|uniref:Uncharacterized protein n=1 Tax=Vibrio genomosp. F6 str. FF-238 TaxID=1191298 RepID=A0A1E5CPY1_9VIBR|nr:DUF5677 domain-containing protein [Vibrio genomosp. F6]OEE71964.1 hypothetical protein A130_18845 [Vibrio genomosp. F6 str. FF-238]
MNWDLIKQCQYQAFSDIQHETLQEKYILLLATRVVELCEDAFMLAQNQRVASVPIVMRSALESYVDLMCLKADHTHIDEMNKSFSNYKAKLRGEKQGKGTKKIWQKFKLINEEKLYSGFYSHLCRSSHGNLETLIRDHVVEERISIGHSAEESCISLYKSQIIGLATTALIEALEYLGCSSKQVEQLKTIRTESDVQPYA